MSLTLHVKKQSVSKALNLHLSYPVVLGENLDFKWILESAFLTTLRVARLLEVLRKSQEPCWTSVRKADLGPGKIV